MPRKASIREKAPGSPRPIAILVALVACAAIGIGVFLKSKPPRGQPGDGSGGTTTHAAPDPRPRGSSPELQVAGQPPDGLGSESEASQPREREMLLVWGQVHCAGALRKPGKGRVRLFQADRGEHLGGLTLVGEVETDPDGKYRLHVPAPPTGRNWYSLRADADGMATHVQQVAGDGAAAMRQPEGFRIDVQLWEAATSIAGRVLTQSGEPVAGALVAVDYPTGINSGSDSHAFGSPRAMPFELSTTTRSGADGGFEFRLPGAASLRPELSLYAVAPGHPVTRKRLVPADLASHVELKLAPIEAILEGVVREWDGRPIVGAYVSAYYEGPLAWEQPGPGVATSKKWEVEPTRLGACTQTDAEGRYMLPIIAASHRVSCEHPDPAAELLRIDKLEAEEGSRTVHDFTFPAKFGLVVECRDHSTRQPVPGATVKLVQPFGSVPVRQIISGDKVTRSPAPGPHAARAHGVSDRAGVARLGLVRPANTREIEATTPNGLVPVASIDGQLRVGPSGASEPKVTLDLAPARVVRFSVVDAEGGPLKDSRWLTVQTIPEGGPGTARRTSQIAPGEVAAYRIGAPVDLIAEVDTGNGPTLRKSVRVEPSPDPLEVVLSTGSFGSLAGKVEFDDGTPAPGLTVRAVPRRVPSAHKIRAMGGEALTGGDGAFKIDNLLVGEFEVAVQPSLGGLAGGDLTIRVPPPTRVRLGEGEMRNDLAFIVSYGRILTGRVRSKEDKPIGGASLTADGLKGNGQSSTPHSISDADGEFIMSGLPDGASGGTIVASHPEYCSVRIPLIDGRDDYEIVMEPRGWVMLRVVDAETGERVSNFRIQHAYGADVRDLQGVPIINAEDPFRLSNVDAGQLEVRIEELHASGKPTGRTGEMYRFLASVPHGELIEVKVGALGTILGEVRLHPSKTPFARARVAATNQFSSSPVEYLGETGTDGRFVIEGVPPGEYTLAASGGPGFLGVREQVRVPREGGEVRANPLLLEGTSLHGRVRRPNGSALRGWGVYAEGGDRQVGPDAVRWSDKTKSGEDGEWSFPAIPQGRVVLHFQPVDGPWILRVVDHGTSPQQIDVVVGELVSTTYRVTVQGRKPIGPVEVIALSELGQVNGVPLESDEAALFDLSVPAGAYWISVHWNGQSFRPSQQIELNPPAQPGELAHDFPAGRVQFEPFPELNTGRRMSISFNDTDGGSPAYGRAISDADGLAWEQFPAGTWTAHVRDWQNGGNVLATATFTVTPGCDIVVPLVAPPASP